MTRLCFLDDDGDLRDVMRELLSVLGHDVLCVGSLREMQALGARLFACDVVLLDINLGASEPSGLDAFRWLRDHGFLGRIAFLTGHGRSLAEALANLDEETRATPMYEKPVGLDVLMQLLRDGRS
jgi:CheY-like chemotaxis protein